MEWEFNHSWRTTSNSNYGRISKGTYFKRCGSSNICSKCCAIRNVERTSLGAHTTYSFYYFLFQIIQSGTTAKILKEGSEPATFWSPLGGKKPYPNYREPKDIAKDPRLFTCSLVNGI